MRKGEGLSRLHNADSSGCLSLYCQASWAPLGRLSVRLSAATLDAQDERSRAMRRSTRPKTTPRRALTRGEHG